MLSYFYGGNMELKVSNGNIKMGNIPSVSLPSVITCNQECSCHEKCYAKKLERLRRTVREAYMSNYNLLNRCPDIYWREVEATIMLSRFFRYHVSGDIPDNVYFAHMIDIADRNPQCEMLCFTKKYSIVNDYLDFGGTIPDNLHIIFSGWKGFEMNNPYNLPEAHVRYRDGSTTARDDAVECSGNCANCAITDEGCWKLELGDQVIFNEH